MFKIFILSFALLASLDANITLQEIESKPPSRAKNFMIWQYLQQDISPKEADKAYSLVKGKSHKIFKLYAKKTDKPEIKEKIACMKERKLLSIKDEKCLELAFSPYKTLSMTKQQRKNLSKKLKSKSRKELLKIQNEPYKQASYEDYDANTVLSMFIRTTSKHRRKNLNIDLSEEFINKLSSSWRISQFVKLVVHDDNLDKLQLSLLNLKGEKLNSKTNFYLALNHLKQQNNSKALHFFNLSKKKAKKKMDVDKNHFWMYKTTKDRKYLDKLLSSKDINIYTIYAYELQNKEFKNYFSAVEVNEKKAQMDIKNPFDWSSILKDIKSASPSSEKLYELSKKYMQQEMIPVQTLILEKAYEYGMHGYVMPYNKYLKDVSKDEKALIYAIMRQESRFIPAALSRSYALGLMQIMPFVTDAISKQIENPIESYDEMFIPQNNINYALNHLEWMKKSLYHPLFMAYAYNGGMGFLRRHLEKGTFNSGKYEPFLSMELMSNSESREYGKKVLANYVMYKKVMGEEVSIVQLFDTLTNPKKTDRFRVQG